MKTSRASALESLAAYCGIEAEFQDARGDTKTTRPATRIALLRAMGIEVKDEASARAALTKLQTEEFTQALRPVYVLHEGREPLCVSIALPRASRQFTWQIVTEDSRAIQGDADFASLPSGAQTGPVKTDLERRDWPLPEALPCGYHQLTLNGAHRSTLVIAPESGWLPNEMQNGAQLWGVAAQVYLLRSAENWGIGDYSDLARLIEMLVPLGVNVVGVNPLHAMFLDDPEQASPYSPASRLLLNVLNIDVAAVAAQTPGFDLKAALRAPIMAEQLKHSRDSHLVDYTAVSQLKLEVLERLFDRWRQDAESQRWQAFQEFRRQAGERFARDVIFLALREHFARTGRGDWHEWPPAYRVPDSAEITAFVSGQEERITYHAWLQYLADQQLAAAAKAAASMAIGLYRDLAVGANGSGAETWGNQTAVLSAVQVGAPPDLYNPAGQNWGLPPFNPRALKAEAYRSFIELIRANMRHAGALRIDHVMALQHLYWVPTGSSPAEGAYIQYPLEDLVGILKLESLRQHCLIVGEDLGTVPAGFRERMAEANILSYRVVFFEKDQTAFIAPKDYPPLAVAVLGSHDLPTLRAWWTGADLDLKAQLKRFPRPEDTVQARQERDQDREALMQALRSEGLGGPRTGGEELFEAAHAFLARTAAALALVQLDDVSNEEAPVNVPTTSTENPNWRRKLSLDLDALRASPRLQAVVARFKASRTPRAKSR